MAGLGVATVNGRRLTDAQRSALARRLGQLQRRLPDRRVSRATKRSDGTIAITGRVHDTAGTAPPPVALQTYQLTGTITDASGNPVSNAVVITRTQDRDFWTFSSASDQNGHYSSFFAASDETSADPVPLSVGVAYGGTSYGGTLGTITPFDRLHSSSMNIQLGSGAKYTISKPAPYPGAVYQGLVVGVSRARRRDQAGLESLARRSRPIHDRAARIDERQGRSFLGEPAPVLHAVTGGCRRAGRPEHVADAARIRRARRTRLAAAAVGVGSAAGREPAGADRSPPTDRRATRR